MTHEEKVFDLLDKTGLNWTVNKLPLISKNGLETNSFGIFRNDNNMWLNTVGSRYVEMQNHTLTDIIVKASEGVNIDFTNGGELNDGKKIYLQAKLPDEFIGKSPVKRYITGLNFHDGTGSIGFGSSNTVVTCNNTFYQAFGELQKFRHTANAEKRIMIAMHDLRISLELEQNIINNFKTMADKSVNDEIVERVISKIFNIDVNKDTKELSTRKKNQIIAFGNAYKTSIQEQGNTVWALFNGVTRYTNHIAAPEGNKLDYIMAGGGYDISNNSFKEIMNWIEENEVKQKSYISV